MEELRITVAALQLKARNWENRDELVHEIGIKVMQAAGAGAKLAVLPEYTGLLVRSAAGFDITLDKSFAETISSPGSELDDYFLHAMGEIARRASIYLVPGTSLVYKSGRILNVAYLLSPAGEVIGWQGQTHLSPREKSWGLAAWNELHVFPTDIGPIGMMVGTDAWYPEAGRILALQGAAIWAIPVSYPDGYSRWLQVAGPWQQVQQNQTFAVEACLTGKAWGIEFRGISAIYGPCEITTGESGFIAQAGDEEDTAIVMAELDFERRRELLRHYPVLELLNPYLYRRYLPALYRNRGGVQ